MKTNHLLIALVLFTALLLSTCSKPIMVESRPVVLGFDADYQATYSGFNEPTPPDEPAPDEPAELQETHLEGVSINIGFGSPNPVNVKISGTWPGLCSKLAEIKQTTNGKNISIRLLATPDETPCPPDHVRSPFEVDLPLNMADEQADTHTVSVNGKETSFDWN